MTLIEVTIGAVLLLLLVGATFSLMELSGSTSNLIYAQTEVQVEVQRALRFVRSELSLTNVDGGGELEYNTSALPANGVWELRYHRLSPDRQIWQGGFDSSDPYGGTNIVWSAEEFVIRYEITDGGNATPGQDDDGDFLVDEGRLAFYRDTGVETLVAVIAEDVFIPIQNPDASLNVDGTDIITPPSSNDQRPRFKIGISKEKVVRSAVAPGDVGNLATGGGPRVSYFGDVWITLRG